MAVDPNWARSVGLTPVSAPAAPSVGPRLNTALPSALASIMSQPVISPGPASSPGVPARPMSGGSNSPYGAGPALFSYADGGSVPLPGSMPGAQLGAPPASGGVQGGPPAPQQQQMIPPEQLQSELQRFMQQHPQQVKQIQEVIHTALQSGELTVQELNLAVQLAVAAAQNPALYPRLRQLAIQKGLASEQDLPQQYDQSIVFALILAGQAMQHGGSAMPGMAPVNPQGPAQQLRDGGGVIPPAASPTGDRTGRADDIKIAVSGGEYVIPAHIVRQKGTDFFDKMIGKDQPK